MRLLLDTHIFLWAVQGNASLKPRVRRMMEAEQIYTDPFDRVLVSQAMTEPLRLLTVDSVLRQYSDLVTLV